MVAHYGKAFGWEGDRLWWSKDGQILEAKLDAPKLPPTSLAAAMQTAAMLSWPVTPTKLSSLELLGRQSTVQVGGKTVLLDVAHNPHAVGRLKERISEWRALRPSADVLAVLGIYRDKAVDDISDYWRALLPSSIVVRWLKPGHFSKDRLVEVLHNRAQRLKPSKVLVPH